MNDEESPDYYIVESETIAESIEKGYKLWMSDGKHKETTMRKFTFYTSKYDNILCLSDEDYKDKWDKLK